MARSTISRSIRSACCARSSAALSGSSATWRSPMPTGRRPSGGRRPVETYDIATALLRFENGVSGCIAVNRSAWGRKGRIQLQIFGDRGTIAYDQERLNEVQLFTRDGPAETQGFRTILTGAGPSALRQVRPGARPRARLQRSQDHRVPRADRRDPGRGRDGARLRGRHRHRAHRPCDRGELSQGCLGTGGARLITTPAQTAIETRPRRPAAGSWRWNGRQAPPRRSPPRCRAARRAQTGCAAGRGSR